MMASTKFLYEFEDSQNLNLEPPRYLSIYRCGLSFIKSVVGRSKLIEAESIDVNSCMGGVDLYSNPDDMDSILKVKYSTAKQAEMGYECGAILW